MASEGPADCRSYGPAVAVLRWPGDADEVARLSALGLPRLLLVEPDAPAPSSACCVQDWVRLPAGEADITGRLRTLEIRAARHSPAPTLDPDGRLAYRGQSLYLSVQLERVARILVDHFDTVVGADVLRDDGWPANMHPKAVHGTVSRLRRQVAPIGLAISHIRDVGYIMHDHAGCSDHRAPEVGAALARPKTAS